MLKAKYKENIANAISTKWPGYELQKIVKGDSPCKFRALVKKPNGSVRPDVSIYLREDDHNNIYADLTNFAEGEQRIRIDVATGLKSFVQLSESENLEEAIAELEAKKKKFQTEIPLAHSSKKTSSFLERKGISLFGKAFFIDSPTWAHIRDPICVPLYDTLEEYYQDKPCSAQIIGDDEDNRSRKLTMKGYPTGGMFHILQDGTINNNFNVKDLLLCESYTTACDVAEAMPDYMVACSAGITGLLKVYDKLKSDNLNVILVMDKVKAGKKIPKAEMDIKKRVTNIIQLNQLDPSLNNITDFNDFAMLKGKKALKKELNIQAGKFVTLSPEAVDYDPDLGFKVLNPSTQTIDRLPKKYLERYLHLCSDSTAEHLIKIMSLQFDDDGDMFYSSKQTIHNQLIDETRRMKMTQPRGAGLFKDGAGYVLNMNGNDRYIVNKKKGKWGIEYCLNIRPFGDNRYVNSTLKTNSLGRENPDILSAVWDNKAMKKLCSIWQESFELDKSLFLFILGFITQALYTSFSNLRPHMWLRGKSHSGKSYILNNIINSLCYYLCVSTQSSTKAGIEQCVNENDIFNAPIVLADEAADDTENKAQKITDLITMTRELFLGGLIPAFKGQSDQTPKVYYRAFSMVMSSVTDSLKSDQDISRFALIDIHGFKLKGKAYSEVSEAFIQQSSSFLRGVLLGAPYYIELCDIINSKFEKRYKVKRDHIGHKMATLTAILGGLASLYKSANLKKPLDICADTVMDLCEDVVRKQIEDHVERLCNQSDITNFLSRTYFKIGDVKGKLRSLCGEGVDSEMWKDYGVRLMKGKGENAGYYSLVINKTNYKLGELLENPKVTDSQPIRNSLGMLIDLLGTSVVDASVRDSTGGKVRAFKVPRFCSVQDLTLGDTV